MKIQKYKNILNYKLEIATKQNELEKAKKINDLIYLLDMMSIDWEIEFRFALDKIIESEK